MGTELGYQDLGNEDINIPSSKKIESRFVHLHVHSEFSLLDGAGKIGELVDRATKLRYPAIAITDHASIDGSLRFIKKCKDNNIQPIVGIEFYIVEDLKEKPKKEKRNHCIYLCKNLDGMKLLMKMLTVANLDGMYHRPRIDKKLLLENFDGNNAILMTACMSGLTGTIWGRDLIKNIFINNKEECVFVELMPFSGEVNYGYFKQAYDFAKKYNIKCVITNDVHYIISKDWEFHESLLAISGKKKKNDKTRWKFDKEYEGELFIKSYKRMYKDSCNYLDFMTKEEMDC